MSHRHTTSSSAYRVNHHTTSPVNLLLGHSSGQLICLLSTTTALNQQRLEHSPPLCFCKHSQNTSKSVLETKQPARKTTNCEDTPCLMPMGLNSLHFATDCCLLKGMNKTQDKRHSSPSPINLRLPRHMITAGFYNTMVPSQSKGVHF